MRSPYIREDSLHEITLKRKIIECKVYIKYFGSIGILLTLIGALGMNSGFGTHIGLFFASLILTVIGIIALPASVYYVIELIKYSTYYKEGLYIKSDTRERM